MQLRAASGCRPVLRLLDYRVNEPDPFRISGAAGARFVLDGFLVTGRGLLVAGRDRDAVDDTEEGGEREGGDLCDVTIRHCTLVPGWDLDCDCSPGRPDEPSITLDRTRARLAVEHSILGSIMVAADERRSDPVEVSLSDSILDSTSPARVAVSDDDGRMAFVRLSLARCTVVGEVLVHAVDLVTDSILTSPLTVARRQVGCVRYSYLAPGSRTPRRHHCQPDSAVADAEDDLSRALAVERVRPSFTSLRYGHPGYCQLADPVPEEIWRGADDEAELGAFHDLYQPQRAANLRARLDEFTPPGLRPASSSSRKPGGEHERRLHAGHLPRAQPLHAGADAAGAGAAGRRLERAGGDRARAAADARRRPDRAARWAGEQLRVPAGQQPRPPGEPQGRPRAPAPARADQGTDRADAGRRPPDRAGPLLRRRAAGPVRHVADLRRAAGLPVRRRHHRRRAPGSAGRAGVPRRVGAARLRGRAGRPPGGRAGGIDTATRPSWSGRCASCGATGRWTAPTTGRSDG
nr:hypothetical protein [Tessaracoccus coleopterorum]